MKKINPICDVNIPIKDKFVANQIILDEKYYQELKDWFVQKYLLKINEIVAENLNMENIHYFKIHIPTNIIKNHKIIKNNISPSNQYHLPEILYNKILDTWKHQSRKITISDEIYYDKKLIKNIHKISSKKDKLSKNFIIIQITIHQ